MELDAIYHQRGWVPTPDHQFRARVADLAAGERWVIDGNYSAVREDVVWPRADTVIWLDPPRRQVMRQITGRTLRRMLLRQELWNGNRESLRNLFSRDPDRSIIMWAWSRHSTYHDRYQSAASDPRWSHLRFIRIQAPEDRTRLLVESRA